MDDKSDIIPRGYFGLADNIMPYPNSSEELQIIAYCLTRVLQRML